MENEENQSCLLERDRAKQPRFYTAQWNDDVHHVLHTAATGEDTGYYVEYRGDTAKLGRALAEGFAFLGQMMTYRGEPRGQPCKHLPPSAFIAFLQNHDQIGNRAFGDRVGVTACREALRAVAATYLLLPQVPMLFMGEEWGSSSPFPFFCDFGPELADAVRKGRREEFAHFPEFQDVAQRERIPDPQADETFTSGKLIWDEIAKPEHREWLDWYRQVIACRKSSIVPLIDRIAEGGTFKVLGHSAVKVAWQLDSGEQLVLAANLSAARTGGFPLQAGRLIWQEGSTADEDGTFGPWTIRWCVDDHER